MADARADGEAGSADASLFPTFAGVAAVAPASTTSLLARGNLATEGATPAAAIRYRVYVAQSKTGIDYSKPLRDHRRGRDVFLPDGARAR